MFFSAPSGGSWDIHDQMRHIISPACSRSSPVPPTSWMCLESFQRILIRYQLDESSTVWKAPFDISEDDNTISIGGTRTNRYVHSFLTTTGFTLHFTLTHNQKQNNGHKLGGTGCFTFYSKLVPVCNKANIFLNQTTPFLPSCTFKACPWKSQTESVIKEDAGGGWHQLGVPLPAKNTDTAAAS